MESYPDSVPIPLERVLRCSLEKINEAKKCRTGANLRKNLMIANVIFKTRNEILECRTRAFIERNRSHPGIKGRLANSIAHVTNVPEKPVDADDVQEDEEDAQVMELETRSEEVLEECVVQEELPLPDECEVSDDDDEDEEEEEEIDVEVCLPEPVSVTTLVVEPVEPVEQEKENSPPSAADSLGPLMIDTEEAQNHHLSPSSKSPRKRRSVDEDPTTTSPSPCKRASLNQQVPLPYDPLGPQCSAPAPAINTLSETFEKAISLLPPAASDLPSPVTLLLPASSLPALASGGHSGVLVLDSSGLTSGGQPLLLQFSPLHLMQQCPAAAS